MKKLLSFLLIGIFIGSTSVLAASHLFSDVKSNQWYTEAISSLAEKDILKGYSDGTFKPSDEVNRAELAVILDRLLTYIEEQDENNQEDVSDIYTSEKLGIKFETHFLDEIIESGNKIGDDSYPNQLEVFSKEKDETIEAAILAIISQNGKDTSKCEVVPAHAGIDTMNAHYKIDLVNKDIIYTQEELDRIQKAHDEYDVVEDGPFDGEWMKRQIYNERLIEVCSLYADRAGLGTSKSSGAYFEYNDYRAKDKFVFVNVHSGGEVQEFNTLEFLMEN